MNNNGFGTMYGYTLQKKFYYKMKRLLQTLIDKLYFKSSMKT